MRGLRADLGFSGEGAVAIEAFSPLSESRRLWAFVSITSNTTQRITTVTPE